VFIIKRWVSFPLALLRVLLTLKSRNVRCYGLINLPPHKKAQYVCCLHSYLSTRSTPHTGSLLVTERCRHSVLTSNINCSDFSYITRPTFRHPSFLSHSCTELHIPHPMLSRHFIPPFYGQITAKCNVSVPVKLPARMHCS
jgi:hypothetical protein